LFSFWVLGESASAIACDSCVSPGYECIPSEYGRFSQLLAGHSDRFGNSYQVRSQEAVSCYRAHTYLACCVMCGAASESVLLALAIPKTGNEERVLRDYGTATGRSKIEKLLLSQQNIAILALMRHSNNNEQTSYGYLTESPQAWRWQWHQLNICMFLLLSFSR